MTLLVNDFENKPVYMTDAYAAEYLMQQGYLAARIEMMMHNKLQGMVEDDN